MEWDDNSEHDSWPVKNINNHSFINTLANVTTLNEKALTK